MNIDEELLIRKAQQGNIEAFEKLVERYDRQVMRLIYNMINHLDATRDLYQEVFLKVFTSIDQFRFGSQFSTWLFRIATNACINYRKHRRVRKWEPLDDLFDGNDEQWRITLSSQDRNPEEQLLNKELQRHLHQALDRLSTNQRAVFVLRHYHGHKLKEIAQILNCSEGTVKNYLFRAVQKMKKSLAGYYQV
ncbi:MAG: sigma-70 family RNA polymerase sigma factor [candidate division KSB1 bacterium]|nr:sigma-70 family RNA polymerase sigma factor [candidate division KSB1 bacterium]MDZ7341365.1 sigma-70 family RNA polymerase sigma factor [candidate division KSB1 bacterium]